MRTFLFSFVFILIQNFPVSNSAQAFPIMVTKGYPACASCHVSPTGGGVLTDYGRGSAGDLLSTWSYENEQSITHGAYEYLTGKSDNPSPVMVQGNLRHVTINKSKTEQLNIFMQKEAEVAVAIDDRLTVVGSIGQYAQGNEQVKQYRRRYVLYQNGSQHFSFRVGKFIPAYGLNMDDHTLGVRSGLGYGEGTESNNLEGSLKSRVGEVILTSGVAKNSQFGETREGRYRVQTEEKFVALRASLNIVEKSLVGFSAQVKQQDKVKDAPVNTQFGFFGIAALTDKLYIMKDNNWKVLNDTGPIHWQPYLFDLVGIELFQGFHVQLYYERKNLNNEYGGRVQWFPRPHWDLSAGIEQDQQKDYTGVFLFHYYL